MPGQGVGDGLEQVGAVVVGAGLGHRVDRALDDVARGELGRGPRVLRALQQLLGQRRQSAGDPAAGHLLPAGELLLPGLPVVGLGLAGHERGLLVDHHQLVRRGRAPDLGLELADELGGLRADLRPPGGEQVDQVASDADDLAGLPVRAGLHPRTHRPGEVGLGDPLGERTRGGLVLVDRLARPAPPHPVGAQDAVEDGLVDVPLRVPLAGVVLEELGDDELVRVDPPPRSAAVVSHAGVARVLLQVGQGGAGARQDGVLDGLGVRVPRGRGL